MFESHTDRDISVAGQAGARAEVGGRVELKNTYLLEAYGPPRWFDYLLQGFGLLGAVMGPLKWVESVDNIVTTAGLNDALDKHLKGSGYTASWFVGLTDGAPTVAAADTLPSHAGWDEVTAYAGNRPALQLGAVAAGSANNSSNRASFSINANSTVIGGAFLASVASGASGVLYSVAAFAAGNKQLDSGDTLNVTVTCTATSP
ncbi:MAG: hypothetical protein AAGI88_09160 [Pseudomonadota bacterium]